MQGKNLKVSIIAFFFLFFAVSFLLRPVYDRLFLTVEEFAADFVANIEEETKLTFHYDSISPSIFTGLRIKNVSITDENAQNIPVAIEKITVDYSIKNVLSKKLNDALESVEISGVTVDYSDPAFQDAILRLAKYFSKGKVQKEKEKIDVEKTLKNIIHYAPDLITIRDIKGTARTRWGDAEAGIKQIVLKKDSDDDVFVRLNGEVRAQKELFGKNSSLGLGFALAGNLTSFFTDSALRVHASPLSAVDYTIGKTTLLFQYKGDSVSVRTLQGVLPISLFVEYFLQEKKLDVLAEMQDFDPLTLLIVRAKNPITPYLRGFRISGKYEANVDIGEKKIFYKADGSARGIVPKLNQSARARYKLSGDLDKLKVQTLAVNNYMLDAEYEGSVNLHNFYPTGSLFIEKFRVPKSDGVMSAEIYVEEEKDGLSALSPQIFFGAESIQAVQIEAIIQKNAIDFSFEASDFSHLEFGEAAEIAVNGSLLLGRKPFLQSSIEIANLFIDSALYKAAFFLKPELAVKLNTAAEKFEPYISSVDLYVSSDFKSFSFNIPYAILANTQKDKEMLVFSMDGNEDTFNISDFDLIYKSFSLQMDTSANLSGSILHDIGDVSFQSSLVVNSMQYEISGSVIDKQWVSIVGDYNLELSFSLELPFMGIVKMDSLPFVVGKNTFALSLDAAVSYSKEEGPVVDFSRVEFSSVSSFFIADNPALMFSGRLDKLGVSLETLLYSDSISALEGGLNLTWDIEETPFGMLFHTADMQVYLMNPISNEQISLFANLMNPEELPLDADAIKSNFYYSVQLQIDSLPMSHFLTKQQQSDTLSANIEASGTIEDPLLSVQLKNLSVSLLGYPLIASGSAVLEQGVARLTPLDVSFRGNVIKDTSATFDIKALAGSVLTTIEASFLKQKAVVPVAVDVETMSTTGGKKIDVVMFSVNTSNITTTFLDNPLSFSLNLIRSTGRFDLLVDGSAGITAYRLDTGEFNLSMSDDCPVRLNADGFIRDNQMDLALSDIFIDLSHLQWIINSPIFAIYNGIVRGHARINGLVTDPDLTGKLEIAKMEMTSPDFLSERMSCDFITATIERNEIIMPESLFISQKKAGAVFASIKVVLDRLSLDHVEVRIRTPEKNYLPIDAKIDPLIVKGKVSADLLLNLTLDSVDVTGTLEAKDTTLQVDNPLMQTLDITNLVNVSKKDKKAAKKEKKKAKSAAQQNEKEEEKVQTSASAMDISVNLDFIAGQHVQILFEPVLHALIAPNTKLSLGFDSGTENIEIEGDVTLRGGEIMYLNRNFYLREGKAVFDKNNSLDPRLTVRAEVRERDSNNDVVTITLSAQDQNVSTFTPRLSASPAKSEAEIMSILGQIVSADSDSAGQIAGSILDYGVQSLAFRKVENTLRDLLNFDIFSIRVTALQNALTQSSSNNQKNDDNKYSIGNFFDNTTVYIGKYFGSFIYVDSLMRWFYDEDKIAEGTSATGLIFQPEIGFEMQSPFANLRLDIAPDVSNNQNLLSSNLWVQATSFTLSWKLNF